MIKKELIPVETYKTIIENVPVVTADIIFLDKTNRKILLCKRNNEPLKDVYYFPGGRIYKGELPAEALKRKVKEELGVESNMYVVQFFGVYSDLFENSFLGDMPSHYIAITYLCFMGKDANIVLDSQHDDFKWFDADDQNLHDLVKIRIKDIIWEKM